MKSCSHQFWIAALHSWPLAFIVVIFLLSFAWCVVTFRKNLSPFDRHLENIKNPQSGEN